MTVTDDLRALDGTDVLDVIERELARARHDLERTVERLDALTGLRTLALELAEHGPLVDLDALRAASHRDPITRARLDNLTTRIASTSKEQP